MKYLIKKDKQRRLNLFECELSKHVKKLIIKNKKIYSSLRWNVFVSIELLEFKTAISNRCFSTGRAHGVLSKFKLSRIAFFRKNRSSMLPGIRI